MKRRGIAGRKGLFRGRLDGVPVEMVLAGLQHSFQAFKIFPDLLLRILTHETGESGSDHSSGRVVEQLNGHPRRPSAPGITELNRSRSVHLGAGQRTPADELTRDFVVDY